MVKAGANDANVAFPSKDIWYDVETLVLVSAERKADENTVVTKNVPADIDKIPAYQRGGSIIPRKLRLRRSSMTMKSDPYTFYVALDRQGRASGKLYMDDEETFAYKQKSAFALAELSADISSQLSNTVTIGAGWKTNSKSVQDLANNRMIERFVIMGVQKPPSRIHLGGGVKVVFDYHAASKTIVIRKPNVSAMGNWTMQFS